MTITSRYDGVVKRLYYDVDQVAMVGSALVDIELEGSAEVEPVVDTLDEEDGSNDEQMRQKLHVLKSLATPAVRRIAMENKVLFSSVFCIHINSKGQILVSCRNNWSWGFFSPLYFSSVLA